MEPGIRKRARPSLVALLLLSTSQIVLPTHGYGVKDAEFKVREREKEARNCPSMYAHALMILATEYWRVGEAKKADRVFRKSIAIAELSQYVDEGDLKSHLRMWAELLAEGRDYNGVKKEDFSRLEKATKRFLAETERKGSPEEKLQAYLFAVEVFDKIDNSPQKNKYQKVLLEFCDKVESNPTADQKDVTMAATILGKFGELEFPVEKLNVMPQRVIVIQPDSNTSTKLTNSRFAAAESYKLRTLKLYERLPLDLSLRAAGHRHLVYWYTLCGAREKAAEQVEILVRMLDSRDPNVLYPPRQPCPGMCGMG